MVIYGSIQLFCRFETIWPRLEKDRTLPWYKVRHSDKITCPEVFQEREGHHRTEHNRVHETTPRLTRSREKSFDQKSQNGSIARDATFNNQNSHRKQEV